MPALYTHYLFTSSLVDKLPYQLNDKQCKLYVIGAQGSDPLYFYGQVFSRYNKKGVNNLANKLHHQDPYSFLNFYIEQANKEEELKDDLYAYLYGYISHYTLDRNIHPYVFYHSGTKGLYDHQVFEANLDLCLLINKDRQELKSKIAFKKKGINKALNKISEIYYLYALNHNFKDIEKNSFIKGLKDMALASKLLCSPKGRTKWFFATFMKNKSANALAIPKKPYLNHDYLNLNKKTWKYPSTKTEANYSILELIDNAKEDYLATYEFLNKVYEGKEYKELLKSWTREIDHDGKHYLSKNSVTKNIYE